MIVDKVIAAYILENLMEYLENRRNYQEFWQKSGQALLKEYSSPFFIRGLMPSSQHSTVSIVAPGDSDSNSRSSDSK